MEIAAASTVSVAPQPSRLSNAFPRKLGSVSSLPCASFKRKHCSGNATLCVSSSSSMDAVVTAEKISPASFLDKRETGGILHFVKYQGLGNDFILVILSPLKKKIRTLILGISKNQNFNFGNFRKSQNFCFGHSRNQDFMFGFR